MVLLGVIYENVFIKYLRMAGHLRLGDRPCIEMFESINVNQSAWRRDHTPSYLAPEAPFDRISFQEARDSSAVENRSRLMSNCHKRLDEEILCVYVRMIYDPFDVHFTDEYKLKIFYGIIPSSIVDALKINSDAPFTPDYFKFRIVFVMRRNASSLAVQISPIIQMLVKIVLKRQFT